MKPFSPVRIYEILEEILWNFPGDSMRNIPKGIREREIASVTADSRDIREGSVFVAIRGNQRDGHDFIPVARRLGAVLILGEEAEEKHSSPASTVPYFRVPDARSAMAQISARFYGNPSHSLTLIGVTGTSGKTTTTYLLESIFKNAGKNVGVIGTVNIRFGNKEIPSALTTPGPVELQETLAEMKSAGCDTVIMEVSSHALKQKRVAFLAFDGMIFTNLSAEHLDFHPDMEDYFRSKAILFKDLPQYSTKLGKQPVAAICGDDPFGRRLVEELKARTDFKDRILTFGNDPHFDFPGTELKVRSSGIGGRIGNVAFESPLTGGFNASNILGAVALARGLGIEAPFIEKGLRTLPGAPGRLERVPNSWGVNVLVDYAHKPDALEKVLQALRRVVGKSRLITVFGCGGDRDRSKRPVMGRLAEELSDRVFVTSDNPRTEDPESIIDEIMAGMKSGKQCVREPNRTKAIHLAIQGAESGDIVLIAGKGHEDYQIIADPTCPNGTRKIPFDDRKVADQALKARSPKLR